MNDHSAVADDAVTIRTTVNVDVVVTVDVLEAPPAAFDHVMKAGVHFVPDARHFPVPREQLRLRASQSNLDRAYEAGVDSDEDPERLRLQIWPAKAAPPAVLNRWHVPAHEPGCVRRKGGRPGRAYSKRGP